MRVASILAIAAALATERLSAAPDDPPETPFNVFVFAADSSGEDLRKATEEVEKRIAARKRWFRIVEDRSEARVVVEVLSHSVEEKLTMWASTGAMRGELEGAGRHSITEEHFLEARATLDGAELRLKSFDTGKKGSLKGAASGLALELEKTCERRYGGNPK